GVPAVAQGRQPRPCGVSGVPATLDPQAEDALRRRDFERARAAAEQAAALQPHDAAVRLVLGKIPAGAGRPADAVEELRRAQRLDPLLPAAYRLCGFALIAVGRFAEAIEQWEQWERLAPRAEEEMAQADVVRQARAAAQVLGGTGTTVGNKGHG